MKKTNPRADMAPRTRRCGTLVLAALGGACFPSAWAGLNVEPYVGATYEHDSNLFRTPKSSKDADSVWRYAGGGEATYDFGQEQAYLRGEARKYRFNQHDELDYNGDFVDGGVKWKATSASDGTLDVHTERRLLSFASRTDGSRALGTQRDTGGEGTANLRLTPEWEVRGRAGFERLRNTLDEDKNFNRNEQTYALGLGYLGQPISSVGAEVEYRTGDYVDRPAADDGFAESFDQLSYLLTARWTPSGISTVEAKGGYTKRKNDGTESNLKDFSGATGSLKYVRTISPKTSLDFTVFHDAESIEVAGENFAEVTGVQADFNWKPTTTLAFQSQYRFGHTKYDSPTPPDRKDNEHTAGVSARWRVVRYVYLIPALDWETRNSNIDVLDYRDFRASIGVELRYQR